jgi:hypothetical protein
LFVRLAAAGIAPSMLSVQYRLHPHLAALPNQLFYAQRLSNGVSASDRAALIPNLPALAFIEIPNGRETLSGGGSFVNSEECHAVIRLSSALAHRVDSSDLGIISLCASDRPLHFCASLCATDYDCFWTRSFLCTTQTRRKQSESKKKFAPPWWRTATASYALRWMHSRAPSA